MYCKKWLARLRITPDYPYVDYSRGHLVWISDDQHRYPLNTQQHKSLQLHQSLTIMLYILRRVLYEHGLVGLAAPDEDGVGGQQPARRQGARLQAPGPHLGESPWYLPRRELHRLTARLEG